MPIKRFSLVFFLLLLLWFSQDLIGIPGLVTRDNLLSAAGILELFLLIILIGYLRQWRFTPFLNLATLGLWGFLQYTAHWQYFFFGASAQKIERYYAFYAGMARFFPESSEQLIPDAFHTILGMLIGINFILAITQIVEFFRITRRQL